MTWTPKEGALVFPKTAEDAAEMLITALILGVQDPDNLSEAVRTGVLRYGAAIQLAEGMDYGVNDVECAFLETLDKRITAKTTVHLITTGRTVEVRCERPVRDGTS